MSRSRCDATFLPCPPPHAVLASMLPPRMSREGMTRVCMRQSRVMSNSSSAARVSSRRMTRVGGATFSRAGPFTDRTARTWAQRPRCSPSARTDEACTGSSSHTRRSSRHPWCLRRLSTAARAALLRPVASSTSSRSTAFCLRRPQARTIRFPQDWTMLVPMCTIPTLHPRRLPTLAATCAVQLAKSRTSSIAPITFSRRQGRSMTTKSAGHPRRSRRQCAKHPASMLLVRPRRRGGYCRI
mmetsp:Transcript_2903/g.11724  ORF Transcript_2903/g.11724 Transcript_2903/m.11724 type:complete len:241 (+) Transcript_2903:621-1343(+)